MILGARVMTHEELIAKSRESLKLFDRQLSAGVSSDDFTEARVVETALVYFSRKDRDDYFEVLVNCETRDCTTATYNPSSSNEA